MADKLDSLELREDILKNDPSRGDLAPGTAVGEALEDPVTGLLPRVMWEAEMRQHLRYAKRTGQGVGLILMDLDNFKNINDKYGHAEGDKVLRKVGDAVKGSFRSSDIMGRYGGDEIVVMVTGFYLPNLEQSLSTRERDYSDELSNKSGVGVSVGMSMWEENESLEDLIKAADKRLYQNKKIRKNVQ